MVGRATGGKSSGDGGGGGGDATSGEQDNTEILAREECSRLARQLRLMENDKKAYLEESNAAIAGQKKTIKALEDENRAIEEELQWYTTRRNEAIERSNWEKVETLLTQYMSMEARVKEETRIIREVEKKLASTTFRATKFKNKIEIAGVLVPAAAAEMEVSMASQQQQQQQQKQSLPLPSYPLSNNNNSLSGEMSKLEKLPPEQFDWKEYMTKRKLETVTSQFDSVVAENSTLRSEIDKFLQENMGIMKRCHQLEAIFAKNKTQIDELVDEATAAYDQREEAVAKANALRDRNEKEKKQFVLEINELNRVIRHEEKLLDFMNTKNKDRLFLETEDERQSRLESAKEQSADETVEMYRENLNKLLTKQSPTFQSLVEEYRDLWNQNITRFNYINELGNELEALQANVEQLRQEIQECSTQTVEQNQQKNEAIIQQQVELDDMKLDYQSVQRQMSTMAESVDEIVELIGKIFKITDFADSKPVLELLGTQDQEISEKTAMLFLNILEHRLGDLFAFRMINSRMTGRATPRSPRYSKTVSELSIPLSGGTGTTTVGANRPMIVLDKTFSDSLDGSEGYGDGGGDDNQQQQQQREQDELIDAEINPLGYLSMRGKVLDSRCSLWSGGGASDTESVISNVIVEPAPEAEAGDE